MNTSPVVNDNTFVLMYHHVGDLDRLAALAPFVVSPPVFHAQLDTIARHAALPRSLEATLAAGPEATVSTRVVLTFDDCPAALLDQAVPAIEQRKFKATFFVVA